MLLSPLVVGRCWRMTEMLFSWSGRAKGMAGASSCHLIVHGIGYAEYITTDIVRTLYAVSLAVDQKLDGRNPGDWCSKRSLRTIGERVRFIGRYNSFLDEFSPKKKGCFSVLICVSSCLLVLRYIAVIIDAVHPPTPRARRDPTGKIKVLKCGAPGHPGILLDTKSRRPLAYHSFSQTLP